MANYYTIVTAAKALECSKQEAAAIQRELQRPTEEDEDADIHGFTFDWFSADGKILDEADDLDRGEGFLNAEECGSWGALPEPALELIGKLIERTPDIEFLEMGAAFTCDKLRSGSHGGAYFRIHPDGHLEEPIITWPREAGALPENPIEDSR